MPPSKYIFKEISSVAVYARILCITCKLLTKCRIVYGCIFLLLAIVLFLLSFVLISSMFWKFSEGGSSNLTLGIMYSYGTVLAIYYLANGERIASNLQDLLELKQIFSTCSELRNLYSFEHILEPHAKRLNAWIKLQFWLNFLALPANFVYKAMSRVKMVDFGNENDLVHAVYFDTTDSAVFWPTVIFQCVSLHTMVVMQTVNDLYILNVTLLLVLFFRYLRLRLGAVVNSSRFSLKSINHKRRSHINENLIMVPNLVMSVRYFGKLQHNDKLAFEMVDKDVKFWIQHHTHLLRLCKDFIQLYTPVLVAYFLNVFLSVSFGTFIVTQDQMNFFSPVEKIIIGSYFIGNVINLLFMCIAGTYLIHESSHVFEDAFHGHWYKCSKATKVNLGIICTATQRPVRLTPLTSQTAELSLETFIWLLRAMVSFYMALTQVKEKFKGK